MMKLGSLLILIQLTLSHAFVAPKVACIQQKSCFIRPSSSSRLQSFGDFKGIIDFFNPKEKEPEIIQPKFETVVIDPDYRVGALFLGVGLLLELLPIIKFTLGPFITLLGILFLVQAARIRFVFDEDSLELVTVNERNQLQDSGENVVVGGKNRWTYKSIINYDFYPKGWIDGPIGPVLVYFKETQTPSDKWDEGPGAIANDPEKVAAGKAVPGQVHFFPAVCNGQQIREEFAKRGCKKI